jgi:hypothetical protein
MKKAIVLLFVALATTFVLVQCDRIADEGLEPKVEVKTVDVPESTADLPGVIVYNPDRYKPISNTDLMKKYGFYVTTDTQRGHMCEWSDDPGGLNWGQTDCTDGSHCGAVQILDPNGQPSGDIGIAFYDGEGKIIRVGSIRPE